ncbi:Hypothetical protein PHPALM_697, partial [Phytophthora palmivora]
MSDYSSFEEDAQISAGEFDQPKGLIVSQTLVAPSYSPRKLRTMPSPPSHPPQSQHRVARPPVSPRSIVKDEELCTTLGKNAELRIRSRDMERTVEKAELELELARKQIKMTERRAENREEKLRALLKEKLNWQKELKVTRAQVVEEKMRQVDLFREVEAAKRHFATELEAVEQELRAAQEENAQLRAHGAEVKAHLNFQTRKMEEMARQSQDEKASFVAMVEETRHRFREWKEGEADALVAAHEQVVRNLKTEYELKIERHRDEKQKLRDKVNDLEVSMRLLQKDRTLSPLELSLRKAAILGSKDNTATMEAGQIEAQSRILELENLLAHSQQYQLRQESIIKLSEATISRLMQEREVTALENLSLHPFGVEPQPQREDLSFEIQLSGYVTAPSSPVRLESKMEANIQNEGPKMRYEAKKVPEAEDEKHKDVSSSDASGSGLVDKVPCESPLPETALCQDNFVSNETEGNYTADTEVKDSAEVMSHDVEKDLLFFCPKTVQRDEDRDAVIRLVVPESLQQDFLHHYHASLEGGQQGIGTSYVYVEDPRSLEKWPTNSSPALDYTLDDEAHAGTDEKEVAHNVSSEVYSSKYFMQESNGTSIPRSFKGNTEVLNWADLFIGYVVAKASSSREAQTVAENYEECVFRRFGASEVIRHDREPGFMADFFRAINGMVKMKQNVSDRMVADYAERLPFALNTAQDTVRGDTAFYLVHGWDPRSTLEAVIPEAVNEKLREAIRARADQHNENIRPHKIEEGVQVWLYLDRVKEGYARKLAHMWHGPFRVIEMIGDHAVRLETAGSGYRIFPIVHLSKLKPRTRLPLILVRRQREFKVFWKGYDDPSWVDEADLNCGALLHEHEKFEQHDTEALTTSHEDVTETDEDVVRHVTKTFAINFVKELMEIFNSNNPNENETNEEVLIHVTNTFAESCVNELLEIVESTTPLEDPVKTNEDEVALVTKIVAENFVKELIEMSSFKTSMIENEADEERAGESIVATPFEDPTTVSTEEFTPLSENEADSVEDVVNSIAISVDTMALARDFMDAVESTAMFAVLHSLQNESCPGDTKAASELEGEGFESDTTRSIMGSDNVSSEEQNEICNDPEAIDGLTNENEEQRSMVGISSAQNEERLMDLSDSVYSIDQLSEEVGVGQSNDIEPTSADAFSTQEIISGVACLFASQTIAEVLNRLTQTCDQADSRDYGEFAESENVNVSGECVSGTLANDISTMMPELVDTELLEDHNEGTSADTDNRTFLISEVIEPVTIDVRQEEALFASDTRLFVEPDANADDVPSGDIEIVQDATEVTKFGGQDDGKIIALLLAEIVDQVTCGETPGISMEATRIDTDLEENIGNVDYPGSLPTTDEALPSEEGQDASDSLVGTTQDEIPYTDNTALPDDNLPATPADNNLDAEKAPRTLIEDDIIEVMEDIVVAIESGNRFEPPESSTKPLLGSATESSLLEEVRHESIAVKGTEVSTLSSEASQFLDTADSKSEDTYKHGDIEPYTASSFTLQLEDNEYVVRSTLDSLVDVIVRSCSALMKEIAMDGLHVDAAESPDEDNDNPEPTFESEMGNVVSDLEGSRAPRHRDRAQSVHFSSDTKEDPIDHLKHARRSVLLWKSPIGTACNKEAVESSAKQRASRRRVSRRTFADLLAFPTEMTRFTSSDTTLLAYDARHEQGQICPLLDESILTINPNGRHIDMDDQEERVASKIIGKRKTLTQELHSKNLALRQIPRFNYMPVCIKFQWSDFVVATSVRPSNCNIGEGHVVKCPVEPMRLLRKKGAKLPCGSYVIVSAFIRPLEDGNENLRVQIYDAERVEEFQFDFSEDIMKKYHLETTGMESQSLEFLGHLEFRRDEDTIIIKLPERKAGHNSNAERLQSERTMIGGGEQNNWGPP